MNLLKTKEGNYVPAYPKDWEESKKIPVGTEVRATKDRNPKFLRKYFALLTLGHENQDNIAEFEIYRMIMIMKSGYVQYATGKDGKTYPLPKSIAFDKMDEDGFEKLYKATLAIIAKECELSGAQIENELAAYY